jgi:hypothetical protein
MSEFYLGQILYLITDIAVWIGIGYFVIRKADFVAGKQLLDLEYKQYKPADTKEMAKQVKKLIMANLPKKEAVKATKLIDKAEKIEREDNVN